MKRFSIFFLVICFICVGCGRAVNNNVHTESTRATTECETTSPESNNQYWEEWHKVEEQEAYDIMRAVLLGEKSFFYFGDSADGSNSDYMNIEGLLDIVFENKANLNTWKMSFIDLDGLDGIKECVIRTDSERHNVLIFHYAKGEVFVTEKPFRACKQVYANGLIEGSGSASNTSWDRIIFTTSEMAETIDYYGWYTGKAIYSDDSSTGYELVPMGSRTEAWITVNGVLIEVPADVAVQWADENDIPGELANIYDFTEDNINSIIVKDK